MLRSALILALLILSKSDYLETKLLDWLRGTNMPAAPANIYWSLHTGNPGETGANEHGATAAYARTAGALGAGNPAANVAAIEYPQASANYSAQITHFGCWDAAGAGAGNFLGGGTLTTPRTISTGDIPRFAAGALTWAED